MTITIPTIDLVGILGDVVPFASPDDDVPTLSAVRVEWDGRQLHTMATDRYRFGWSTWDPYDLHDVPRQDDLFTTWGSGDDPWHIYIPRDDAKDIISAYKLPPKEAIGVPLTVEQLDGQLRLIRSRNTGHSAITMTVQGAEVDDAPDLRKLLANHDTAHQVTHIAFSAKVMARRDDKLTPVDRRLIELTTRVDRALALVHEAMRAHVANRPLVDLGLDVTNALRGRR